MNRREMLTGITHVAAAAGVAGVPETVDAEPEPLLLLFKTRQHLHEEARVCLNRELAAFRDKHPELPPIMWVPMDADVEVVVDPKSEVQWLRQQVTSAYERGFAEGQRRQVDSFCKL